jgi:hypothetical protein
MTTTKTITIDDTEYVRADSLAPPHDSEVRIVVLQRGWVLVGRYREDGDRVLLSDAHVIERWGTTKGLGELVHGPTADTRLRHAGSVEAHRLGVVLTIAAETDKWAL